MTITYPLSLPSSPAANSIRLVRRSVTGMTASPYTGEQYVIAYPGQWFEAEIGLPDMDRDDAASWRAFFAKLNGMEGTFLMGDPTAATPRGSAGVTPGTPLVKGADQTGNELDIDGCPLSATGYLKAGDYIQLGTGLTTRLHMVLDDANTNGSGEATLLLWPNLRAAPADNAAVTVSACKGLFRLAESMSEDHAVPFPFFQMGFKAIEAL